MSSIEGITVFDNDVKLQHDLNEFNRIYDEYKRCVRLGNLSICPVTKADLTNAYEAVQSDIQNVDDKLNSDPLIPVTEYDASYNYIVNTYYKNVLPTRDYIDMELKEINNTSDSISSEMKMNYDLTIYVGMLWMILATSILYMVFVRL